MSVCTSATRIPIKSNHTVSAKFYIIYNNFQGPTQEDLMPSVQFLTQSCVSEPKKVRKPTKREGVVTP